ncbi:LapA family protein [Brachybacterium paraconglomeratum]|uniref:LapA family protein n=1 Tax=Brachybacterium paraconglomeratum TaxID=173362 RepID=UPI0022B074F9|nr:lipopolysaccharide assembly protein LapA domain-containing protein [Brachybacterium paraconglomeratum]MCZ4326797.1 lipopolysaccharide assembly protein LapA domain-containing protein [Brachybacterium paraconglomeratum]
MRTPDDPTRRPGPADAPTPRQDGTVGPAPTGRRAAERPTEQEPNPGGTVPVEVGKGGKTASTWIALILGAIVLVLLLIFVIQNNQTAGFEYFSAQFDLPLGVAMLLAAIAGALVMALVGSVRMIQMGWTIRKLRKQQEKVQRTLR